MPILAEEGSLLLLQVLRHMIDGTVCNRYPLLVFSKPDNWA